MRPRWTVAIPPDASARWTSYRPMTLGPRSATAKVYSGRCAGRMPTWYRAPSADAVAPRQPTRRDRDRPGRRAAARCIRSGVPRVPERRSTRRRAPRRRRRGHRRADGGGDPRRQPARLAPPRPHHAARRRSRGRRPGEPQRNAPRDRRPPRREAPGRGRRRPEGRPAGHRRRARRSRPLLVHAAAACTGHGRGGRRDRR